MKLRTLFYENTNDTLAIVNDLFPGDTRGRVLEKDGSVFGWDFIGKSSIIDRIPIKFSEVFSLDLQLMRNIKSFDNFPDRIPGSLDISGNKKLLNFAGAEHITAIVRLMATNTNLVSLEGIPVASAYYLSYNKKLTSIAGIPSSFVLLELAGCPSLTNIDRCVLVKFTGDRPYVRIDYSPNLSLTSFIISRNNPQYPDVFVDKLPYEFEKTFSEYVGKGIGAYRECKQAIKQSEYASNA
jgi:hypothetical protein